MVVFGESCCIRANVVAFVQSGRIRKKKCYSGKLLYSGEVVVLEQKWLSSCKVVVFLQSFCIEAKLVLFRQKWLY